MPSKAIAVMSRKWALRMGIVALAFAGFALWCIYDAQVTYPRYNRRAEAYNQLLQAEREEQWPDVAAENNWDTHFDEADKRVDGTVMLKSPWDIGTQYVMMAICLVVAVLVGGRILLARNRTMRADDKGLHAIEGNFIPYDAIEELDMSRWNRKSIVTVHYRVKGVEAKTRIDDWVYEGGEDVLAEVQKHTGLGKQDDAAETEEQPQRDPDSPETPSSAQVDDAHDKA